MNHTFQVTVYIILVCQGEKDRMEKEMDSCIGLSSTNEYFSIIDTFSRLSLSFSI